MYIEYPAALFICIYLFKHPVVHLARRHNDECALPLWHAFSYIFATYGGFYACGLSVKDRMYLSLPMYHMSGGVLGAGAPILFGMTGAVRKKFSASNFWPDCIRFDCTVVLQQSCVFSPTFFVSCLFCRVFIVSQK